VSLENVSAELKCADAEFRSVDYLLNITAPTLALHAEDDTVVPVHLGEKFFILLEIFS